MNFEWDIIKEKANIVKHELDFSEAMTVFGDPFEITISDPDHSEGEYRFLSIGLSSENRVLIVSYTERDDCIHIISARKAEPKERRQYESRK